MHNTFLIVSFLYIVLSFCVYTEASILTAIVVLFEDIGPN